MEVGRCARGVQRRAGGTSARSTDCGCGRKLKGRLQVRVQYVEAVYMRAGAEVTVCRRGSAGAVRGVRGRGSEAEGTKVLTSPKWKIRGDARAVQWCKSESEGTCAPGITSSVQWSRSPECGHRSSVSTSAGGRETASGPIAIENREITGGEQRGRVGKGLVSMIGKGLGVASSVCDIHSPNLLTQSV